MRWFMNLRTSVKLLLGFAVMVALIVGVGWINLHNASAINDNVENLYQVQLQPSLELTKIRGLAHQHNAVVYQALAQTEEAEAKAAIGRLPELQRKMDDLAKQFESTIRADSVRTAYTRFTDADRRYRQHCDDKISKPLMAGNTKQAFQGAKDSAASYREVLEAIDETLAVKVAVGKDKYERSQQLYSSSRWMTWATVAVGALLGLALGIGIARTIATPLRETVSVIEAVANGDLSRSARVTGTDEVGRIAAAVNQAIGVLRQAEADRGLKDVEIARTQSMVDNSPANVLFADRDLVVRYINPKSIETLKKLERFLPIRADEMLGRSIDIFHKRPEHQRSILSNPRNLPHRAQIQVGTETLDLLVTAIYDQNRNHIGAMLTWEIITQRLALEARNTDCLAQIEGIGKIQAVIEFQPDGTVVTANENFLATLGYRLNEIQGQHHSTFVEPSYAASQEYREFWSRLNRGDSQAGTFKRIGKGGKEVWIQAIYIAVPDTTGKVVKVVKYASDLTQAKKLEQQTKEVGERQLREAEELKRKVDQILVSVDALANGDFTQSIPDLGTDTVGKMGEALNHAIDSMRDTLAGVRQVADQLAEASGQLSIVSQEIAAGAQEQASSLEETSSTLEEITITVKQNAENAQQARQLAAGSRDTADKGGQVVTNAVGAMGAINQSSKKIADIITTIDEIAFQTNLLALNAAVEAARAGEQGRGFAVVAAEVRNLAQRSAIAAKEIKDLIQDSVQKVGNGTDLVNRSGQSLDEIVTSVKQVTDIVGEIAAASREQSMGIDQVAKAVQQMDVVTQRNASQTEEMSATAETLSSQAEELQRLVAGFRLGDETAAKPTNRREPAPRTKPSKPAPRKPASPVSPSRLSPKPVAASHNGHPLDQSEGENGFQEY